MSVKNIKTLTLSEISGYLVSPAAYVFVIIFLVLSGFFTFMMSNFFKAGDASLGAFFFWHPWLYLILVPALGMHLWSDEKRLGTNELLFTLPVSLFECVISKFLAAWLFVAVALFLTFPMVVTVCYLGHPDTNTIIAGYFGSFLLGGAYLSIASFTSSISKSQVVSFIISVVVCFFLILAGWPQVTDMLVQWAPRELIDIVAAFSVWPHFQNMQRGIIDLRDILYFVSIIVYSLFLCSLSLKNRKGNIASSIVGAVVLAGIVIMVNVICVQFTLRADVTENKVFTLSEGSKRILAKVNKPVTIKFYCSRSTNQMPVQLKNYATRVEDLLKEYVQNGHGQLYVEKFDPKPFSDAEDSAIMDGVAGQSLPSGDKIFLGLAVTCGKKTATIPFLSPMKENTLEYDLTHAITEVFKTKKTVVGVMSALKVMGGPPSPQMMQRGIFKMTPAWLFVEQLKKDYIVRNVPLTADKIDDDLDLLILVHPAGISDKTQFGIDQYLLKGGKVVAFVDPMSFVAQTMAKGDRSLMGKTSSSLPKLFKAWNIQYDGSQVVADAIFARRMRTQTKEANFLAVLDMTKRGFDESDVVTSQLDSIMYVFGGSFSGTPPDGVKKEVLLHSTKDSGKISTRAAANPELSFKEFTADGEIYDLAIKLTGTFKTAFPDGAPSAVKGKDKKDKKKSAKPEPLKKSVKPGAVVLIGDSDMLFDEFCVRRQNLLGQQILIKLNDNLNFVQNLADALGGDSDMISIRCRPTVKRPFERVKKLVADAEKRFKSKIMELKRKLERTQRKLNESQKRKSASQQMILSPEQKREIKKFRKEQIQVRKELRNLQKQFRSDLDSLENELKWLNILLVPFLVAVFGVVFGIIRKIKSGVK
ncbi:MAG: hypothetical protein GXP32_02980 [Kiritimatiellaeota bacterium]|nr:hypothetical protein [Kiritimatiellota bacterium]